MMLNTRQRILFYFLKKAENSSRFKLAKIFFLMKQEGKIKGEFKFYSFVPYRYGPYSFELFHDIERLEKEGMLAADDKTVSCLNGEADLSPDISRTTDYYLEEPFMLDDMELVDYVYEKYPEYTIFSEIERKMDYVRDRVGVCTIGYEGMSIDEFIMKLVREKVQVLVDVRNNPWSMKFGFKKQTLKSLCKVIGIEYIGLPSLGIPGDLRQELRTKRDYEELFKKYRKFVTRKKEELRKLNDMAKEKRIALMCFEKDPEYCHRTIIAKELAKMGA